MQLRIPGPTPLPAATREALARQMISHRGAEFERIFRDITARLQDWFQTENDVLIFPAAGTGGLEAALVNTLSPGDTVIACSVGAFGDRWAEIATAFGLHVVPAGGPWGTAVDPATVRAALGRNPIAKAILLTHNETSTGVLNDVAPIAALAREYNTLLLVDSISGAGGADLPVDRWGVDVAVTAAQKAWMAPPGLTMLTVSARAWEAHAHARLPRFYWDFSEARKYAAKGQTPYTPAVSLLYALQASLHLMAAEGRAAVFARHLALRDFVRGEARRLGLAPLVPDAIASPTVTALQVPDADTVLVTLRTRGVIVADGQGPLKGAVLRVGHMGLVSEADLAEVVRELGAVLDGELVGVGG
jgi:aspartate aminotransferase-like enzyme